MSRSYLFRRPAENDDDDTKEIIRAKPINPKLARNLGTTFSRGKDFVKASQKSQQEFYGQQTVLMGSSNSSSTSIQYGNQIREMTHDERNKLNASIIKAELRGDKEKAERLKKKLEKGVIEMDANEPTIHAESTILMKMDRKSGIIMPLPLKANQRQEILTTTKRKGSNQTEFEKIVNQMVTVEKQTTAEDQITMFNITAMACGINKSDDDYSINDNTFNQLKKRRHQEKDNRQRKQFQIQEHKFTEQILQTCSKCIESQFLDKHAIVSTGFKTYLSVVKCNGLSPDHCYIAPMAHYASSVIMDEDVWEEMQIWMKGLVAMWRDDDDQDCVFVENAMFVHEQRHMIIECIPLPKEYGNLAPIYFKKAILECEKEWSDNRKLIDLSEKSKGVRGAIPKGFPYFAINFGLQPGYAHVIEEKWAFSENFAHEIIGGMLDLPHYQWKNPKCQSFEEIRQRRNDLQRKWAKYDWTNIAKQRISDTNTDFEDDAED